VVGEGQTHVCSHCHSKLHCQVPKATYAQDSNLWGMRGDIDFSWCCMRVLVVMQQKMHDPCTTLHAPCMIQRPMPPT
jgi:hypothetical protein